MYLSLIGNSGAGDSDALSAIDELSHVGADVYNIKDQKKLPEDLPHEHVPHILISTCFHPLR